MRPFRAPALLALLLLGCDSNGAGTSAGFSARRRLAPEALGCYSLAQVDSLRAPWYERLQPLAKVRLDSALVSAAKPGLRQMQVTKLPTLETAAFWAADSSSGDVALFLVDQWNALRVVVHASPEGYEGVATYMVHMTERDSLTTPLRFTRTTCEPSTLLPVS